MTKNTASQKIGAQLVSASDGSAFTGSVSVVVTIDAATQGGGGSAVHEGNGYHTYSPSQAETNGDLLAFTFTGTGAVPVTVQVFTTGFPKSATTVPGIVQGLIHKNTAYTGFMFGMTDSTNHAPVTGKTVTVYFAIDGVDFVPSTNSASEVSAGVYKINLAAADVNGDNIIMRATAASCDDTFRHIITVT